jgi:hypothetical protein
MTLSGIRLIRQVFGDLLPPGYTVAQAYLSYKHEHDVEWQVLTFHVNGPDGPIVGPDGKPTAFTSDKVPAKDDVNELAAKTARRFVEGLKDVQTAPAASTSDNPVVVHPASDGDKTLPS